MSDSHGAHHHIVPVPLYITIFLALLVMTGLTVAVAYVDMGAANIYVALAIAFVKATLVVLFFMHVKYSSRLVQLAAATGFIWLAFMLAFTLADVWTRNWQPVQGWAPQFVDEPLGHGEAPAAPAGEGH